MRAGGLEETVLTTATKTDVRARRVLLIEDDTASAQALSEMLELEGYEVRAVRNGADAIDVLHTFTPDAVVVDLQLPVMDGRSFIELYRRRVRPAASIIVMSRTCESRFSIRAISDSAMRRNRDRSAGASTCESISVAIRIDARGFLNSCDTSDAKASVDC